MRISPVTYQSNPIFQGENSTKHKLKNAVGAAAIALAAMTPATEAEAQYPIYPYSTSIMVSNRVKVPSCFKYGDARNIQTSKTREERFNEIDKNANGLLSENEVINTEIINWNSFNPMKATISMVYTWQNLFRRVSQNYNQEDSNPRTINYDEFNEIMDEYDSQFVEPEVIAPSFPVYPYPYIYTPLPPPPHHHKPYHHHHHHRH